MGLRISPAGLFLYFSLLIIIMKLLIFSLPVNPSIPSLKERKDPSKAVLPGFLTFLGIFLLCRKHVLKSPFGISAQFIQPICQSVAGLIIYMMLHPVWISRLLKDLHHPRYCLFGRPSVIITHTQKQHHMRVATIIFTLRAPWVHSLKEKRRIVKSIVGKLQNKFHLSAAEIDEQDTHQTIVIGVAGIVPNNAFADSLMDRISMFVEENCEAEIVGEEREIR